MNRREFFVRVTALSVLPLPTSTRAVQANTRGKDHWIVTTIDSSADGSGSINGFFIREGYGPRVTDHECARYNPCSSIAHEGWFRRCANAPSPISWGSYRSGPLIAGRSDE